MVRGRAFILAAVAAAALVGAAESSARTWSRPVGITEPAPPVGGLDLGFDARGRGLAAWGAVGPATVIAGRSARGVWSSPQRLPNLSDFSLAAESRRPLIVAMRPGRSPGDDLPVAVEVGGGRRIALDRPVRGKWVTDPPALAGNARGDAIVAWSRYGPEEDGFGCEKWG
ncbi:MAG: hypothetical protein M3340_11370, partial [Actinomycetota bacterium]|nr:hypothetical protein [Actinomycetota bacterium]